MGLPWLTPFSSCRAQRAGGSEYRQWSARLHHQWGALGGGSTGSTGTGGPTEVWKAGTSLLRGWGHHVQERDACHPWCDTCFPQAAYLQQAGLRTAVLEKRHVLGGAAVTEEIVPGTLHTPRPPARYLLCASLTTPCSPGFKFSRASYLLSLLRPQIYTELELQVLLPSWHAGRVSLLPGHPCSFHPDPVPCSGMG